MSLDVPLIGGPFDGRTWLFLIMILLLIGVFDLWVIMAWGKRYSISHQLGRFDDKCRGR